MSYLAAVTSKHGTRLLRTHPRLNSSTRLALQVNPFNIEHRHSAKSITTSSSQHVGSICRSLQSTLNQPTSLRKIKLSQFHTSADTSASTNQSNRKPICEFCEKEPTYTQYFTESRNTSNSCCKTCFDKYRILESLECVADMSNPEQVTKLFKVVKPLIGQEVHDREFEELVDKVIQVLYTPTINQVDLSYAVDRYASALIPDEIDVEITGGSLQEIEEQHLRRFAAVAPEVSDEEMLDKFKLLLEIQESVGGYVCSKEKVDAMNFPLWEACEEHYRFVEGIE